MEHTTEQLEVMSTLSALEQLENDSALLEDGIEKLFLWVIERLELAEGSMTDGDFEDARENLSEAERHLVKIMLLVEKDTGTQVANYMKALFDETCHDLIQAGLETEVTLIEQALQTIHHLFNGWQATKQVYQDCIA